MRQDLAQDLARLKESKGNQGLSVERRTSLMTWFSPAGSISSSSRTMGATEEAMVVAVVGTKEGCWDG